jgi:hypothetical protein
MRTVLLLPLILFLVACGTTDRSRLASERQFEADMRERYDFAVLTRFLRQVIADHPVYDNGVERVDLICTNTRIEDSWHLEGVGSRRQMRNGDWEVSDHGQGHTEFELTYIYDSRGNRTRRAEIAVKRLAKDQFRFISIGVSVELWDGAGTK